MKRRMMGILGTLLFLGSLGSLKAQTIHDPNDPIYRDIDRWAVQGYFNETLPFIRPYPAQLLDQLLNQVIDRGREADKNKAAAYKKAVTTPERFIHVGARGSVEGLNDNTALEAALFADGIIRLGKWASASYAVAANAITRVPGEEYNVPGTWSPYPDLLLDQASIGSFTLLQNWTSALAVGNAEVYFQAGLNRSSFGPFYDNGLVVGPQAGRAGHFSLNYRQPKWSFEMMLLELSASDNLGRGQYPNKHLMLHSINFRPIRNLELGFIESVIWGGRFEFMYIIPFNELFVAETIAGLYDNAFMGLTARWTGIRNTQLLFQLYVDDFQFNDFMRLKFNSKYKLAGEIGGIWSPKDLPILSLAADYSFVFPYMYTHFTTGDPEARYTDNNGVNYNTYSHLGRNLGPDLQPNSDRVSLRTRWQALPRLELSASAYLTRHANASDGVDDMEYWHDGSIFDDGSRNTDPYDNNYRKLHFLTQSTIDTRLGGGIGVGWSLPVSFGVFSINADYVLEYGWNRDLHKGNNGLNHYWSFGGSFRW